MPTGTELWMVLYLHNWDPDGKVCPQCHSIHSTWQAAEEEKRTRIDPGKYWVVRGNLRPD